MQIMDKKDLVVEAAEDIMAEAEDIMAEAADMVGDMQADMVGEDMAAADIIMAAVGMDISNQSGIILQHGDGIILLYGTIIILVMDAEMDALKSKMECGDVWKQMKRKAHIMIAILHRIVIIALVEYKKTTNNKNKQ